MDLSGKVAIVTGGGSGIGREIGIAFAGVGVNVFMADLNVEAAKAVVAEIGKRGGQGCEIKVDITDSEEVHHMVETVLQKAGNIHILVNSAGIPALKPFLDIGERSWDRTYNVYFKGPFLCTQAVAKVMVERGIRGKIINVISIAAHVPSVGQAHYCAMKAGLSMLTKVAAMELASFGINVNAINPGIVKTALTEQFLEPTKSREMCLEHIPIGKLGQPEDVAGAALFLVSDTADFVIGQELVVDGGTSLMGMPNMLDVMRRTG